MLHKVDYVTLPNISSTTNNYILQITNDRYKESEVYNCEEYITVAGPIQEFRKEGP